MIGDLDPEGIVTTPRRECETVAGREGTVNTAAVVPSIRTASMTVSTTVVVRGVSCLGGVSLFRRSFGNCSTSLCTMSLIRYSGPFQCFRRSMRCPPILGIE